MKRSANNYHVFVYRVPGRSKSFVVPSHGLVVTSFGSAENDVVGLGFLL